MTQTFRTFRIPSDCVMLVDPVPPSVEIIGDTITLTFPEWDDARSIPIDEFSRRRKEREL